MILHYSLLQSDALILSPAHVNSRTNSVQNLKRAVFWKKKRKGRKADVATAEADDRPTGRPTDRRQ